MKIVECQVCNGSDHVLKEVLFTFGIFYNDKNLTTIINLIMDITGVINGEI